MSNKMLWKRLLATGMSMAMAATLFMTNSVATYAAAEEEAGADPNPVIAGDTEDSWAPEVDPTDGLPAPESGPTSEAEAIVAEEEQPNIIDHINRDGSIDRTVIVIEETKEYYSDMNSVEDGVQTDDYQQVEKEDIGEDQQCDFVDVEEIKSEGESRVYLEYENEEGKKVPVTVKNEDGEEVVLELPERFNPKWQMHDVKVVETELYTREVDPKNVIYGYFEEGKFIELQKGEEGAKEYVYTGSEYEAVDTMYSTVDINGDRVFIDEMTAAALRGEESDYSVVKEYSYKGVTYSEDDLKKLEDGEKVTVSFDNENYTVDVNNSEEKNDKPSHLLAWVPGTYAITDAFPVTFNSYEVTEAKKNAFGWTYYKVDYYFEFNNHTYVVTRDKYPIEMPSGTKVGDKIDNQQIPGFVDTGNEDVYKLGKTTTGDLVTVTVYDKDGTEIFKGDKRALTKINEAMVTEVGDKVRVDVNRCEHYYLDKEDYKLIREHEEILNVTESYYYTVQDKGAKNVKEYEFSNNDKDYKLNVEFWENSRIGLTGLTINPQDDGSAEVIINYIYSTFDNMDGDLPETSYSYTIPADKFSSLGEATLKIKYLPIYFTTIEEHQNYLLKAMPMMFENTMDSAGLFSDELLFEIAQEAGYSFEYDPGVEDLGRDNYSHRMILVGPNIEPIPGEEPQPQPEPNPNPNPTPDTTPSTPATIDVTPVALAAAPAAPAAQVLGAQREEPVAGEAPAVLGASRARGTADETTAPFVRVIIMAAVASAALFLTRKREEEN